MLSLYKGTSKHKYKLPELNIVLLGRIITSTLYYRKMRWISCPNIRGNTVWHVKNDQVNDLAVCFKQVIIVLNFHQLTIQSIKCLLSTQWMPNHKGSSFCSFLVDVSKSCSSTQTIFLMDCSMFWPWQHKNLEFNSFSLVIKAMSRPLLQFSCSYDFTEMTK